MKSGVYLLVLIALLIFVIEALALISGVNGTALAASIGVFGAIAGFIFKCILR